ncbi:MAG: oligosaccharide flippase family protein [Armatimonadetes bacterium]|nr:oligosaccharide flippase family protein [Armatimonadota bacterium]
MTGTGVSQALVLLAAPALSRLYDPAAFGVFSLFVAAVSVITPLVHMQYASAVVLPKEDRDAGALFFTGNAVVLAVSTLSLVVVAFGRGAIAELLNAPDLAWWLWWLPPVLLLTGMSEILSFWATRRKRFWSISSRYVARSVAQVAVQLLTGIWRRGPGGLVAGTIVGQAVETMTLGVQVLRKDARVLAGSLHGGDMRRVASEYRMFPQYGAPATFLNGVSQSIPAFILSGFFGTSLVGLYGMTLRVIGYPVTFVKRSVRQALLQRVAEIEARGESNLPLFRKATLALVALAAPPTIAVVVVGPWLFSTILGDEWAQAGEYARWLVLWIVCGLANVPATTVLQVLKRQRLLLGVEIGLVLTRVIALIVPSVLGNAYAAIVAYAGVGIVFNLGLVVVADVVLRRQAVPPALSEGSH